MSHVPTKRSRTTLWLAGGVGLVTGLLSAVTLNPLGEASDALVWWPGELLGFLSVFALSAGLIYGVLGGGFARLRLGFAWRAVAAFALTSMVGIAAAVYVAMLMMDYDASTPSFAAPYLAASPVGALIMAVPVVVLAQIARPVWVVVRIVALTTAWSLAVAVALGTGEALSVPWLMALFAGWQALFLVGIAAAERKA